MLKRKVINTFVCVLWLSEEALLSSTLLTLTTQSISQSVRQSQSPLNRLALGTIGRLAFQCYLFQVLNRTVEFFLLKMWNDR
jgi:hypothetical protein